MFKEIALGLASMSLAVPSPIPKGELNNPTYTTIATDTQQINIYGGEFGFYDVSVNQKSGNTYYSNTAWNSHMSAGSSSHNKTYGNWNNISSGGGVNNWGEVISYLSLGSSHSMGYPAKPYGFSFGADFDNNWLTNGGFRLAYYPCTYYQDGEDMTQFVFMPMASAEMVYKFGANIAMQVNISNVSINGVSSSSSWTILGRWNAPYSPSTPSSSYTYRSPSGIRPWVNDGNSVSIGCTIPNVSTGTGTGVPLSQSVAVADSYFILVEGSGETASYAWDILESTDVITFDLTFSVKVVNWSLGGNTYDNGYSAGYDIGYNAGYSAGSSSVVGDSFSWIGAAFDNVVRLLNIQLLPGFSLALLISLPIAGAVLVWLLKLLRG